jgi:hypothetical protein
LVYVHLVRNPFEICEITVEVYSLAGGAELLHLEFQRGLDLVSLLSTLKVKRKGTHYKFLPV